MLLIRNFYLSEKIGKTVIKSGTLLLFFSNLLFELIKIIKLIKHLSKLLKKLHSNGSGTRKNHKGVSRDNQLQNI